MSTFSIQHPLMVFYQVHRRTGTIERSCIFTNQESEAIQLDVNYDFAEHSWVQIYNPGQKNPLGFNGHSLTLKPGENTILLSFNTNNFNFPDASFKGRISFKDPENGSAEEWIEINFEHIDDLEPFQGYAAIDIGTSTSTLSLFHIRHDAVKRMPWTPKLAGDEETVPSAVYIRNFHKFVNQAEGGCLVGDAALETFRVQAPRDPRCLQLSTKRLLGSNRILAADERESGGFVDPLDLLYVLGRFVRERAQNHKDIHSLIQKVNVTFPPTWSYHHIRRWRELFCRIGFRDEDLDLSLDEASAAGLYYIYNCVRERDALNSLIQDLLESQEDVSHEGKKGKGYTLNLLSLDLGGGTMDLALIEARLELYSQVVRLRLSLVGSDSCDYGGDQVTLAVFRILKRRLAMAFCDPERAYQDRFGERHEAADETQESSWFATPIGATIGSRGGADTFVLPDKFTSSWKFGPAMRNGPESEREKLSREVILENWGYLSEHIESDNMEADLDDAVDQLFPTRFLPSSSELFRVQARRNFDWLWERAEHLKKRLFNEVNRLHVKKNFPAFEILGEARKGITLEDVPQTSLCEAIPWHDDDACEKILSVGADEVFGAIREPLEQGFVKASKLAGSKHIDRVVLSGQSSRIPMVRWMFARPHNEGGLGIPLAKIEFDEENAKTAVSKGACLLHVMRDTLVGFEVDVADFKANLLSDIFYLQVDGSRRNLFLAGSVDDFDYVEETPDARAFPKYLSVFYGSEESLIGQFLLKEEGEKLPPVPTLAADRAPGKLPTHKEFLGLGNRDRSRYTRWASLLLEWSERQRIAWMEASANAGSEEEPIYRYYLTRNHNLFAVKDKGPAGKRLFELKVDEPSQLGLDPKENPFSGIH